ncbi:GIY-YIG nuclease family protein [bacterium AH-315-P13]|nr:GIY-YIG nuclease family protein [bacterium AH-315-P13]
MADKTFNQEFDGYWRETNKTGLPKESGVYVVQSCLYNKEEKTVSLIKLIYIGKADNLNERVNNHEKLEDWKKELKDGEELCYSMTMVSSIYNERVEAALINSNQPIINIEYKDSFPFDKTNINCSKKYSTLKENVIVIKH